MKMTIEQALAEAQRARECQTMLPRGVALVTLADKVEQMQYALLRMVDMIDFHYRDGCLPKNETDVPMELAREAMLPPNYRFQAAPPLAASRLKPIVGQDGTE